ncbi:hypothetical protein [Sphingomonas faeni]|uniref:hypothetical protein n=1 Tax=Sphingomonas faeni TaxID=185950 RepID=UPI0020C74841|nr:hypothetical protein [Sphingomonas faeni]MCP8889804.1 hypothetical protein [Sphingomonas faeni]
MKVQIVPDIPSEFPQWIRLAQVLSQEDVIATLMFKARAHSQMNHQDAADAIIALFAWRDVTGYSSIADKNKQARMFDLNEMSDVLGIDVGPGAVASIGNTLEQSDYIMHDSPPEAVGDDAYYAYLNGGGLERGLSVLGRMYEERVFPARNSIPTAFGTVSLNHNDPKVVSAINLTEQALEAIRASNSISDDDKQTWLSHIDAGLALIKKPKIYLSAISLLLIQPLYSAYSSILEDSAKPIIAAALHALKTLIGF